MYTFTFMQTITTCFTVICRKTFRLFFVGGQCKKLGKYLDIFKKCIEIVGNKTRITGGFGINFYKKVMFFPNYGQFERKLYLKKSAKKS